MNSGQFDLTDHWWLYLDSDSMEVFATAIDSASGLVYERNDSILQIRDRIASNFRESSIIVPTLKIGMTERTTPTQGLMLLAA